jgi:hypothetical protein
MDPLLSSCISAMSSEQPDHCQLPEPTTCSSATGATEPCHLYLRNQRRNKRKREMMDTTVPFQSTSNSHVDVSHVLKTVHTSDALVLDDDIPREETALIEQSAFRHCSLREHAVLESVHIVRMDNIL